MKVSMQPLSPQQRKVFDRLREFERRTGETPELSAFARGLGIHYVSLKQHLLALDRKGYLRFESRGRGRSPRLTLPDVATGVPLLGAIPAGPLADPAAHAEGVLRMPGLGDGHFALRVDGDSMADLLQSGDVVILERRAPARSGEICAVRVDDDDVTLKYLDREAGGALALRPHNRDYPTLSVPAQRVQVDGVYRGLLRGDAVEALLHGLD
jgi:repressor LexA